MNQLYDIIHLEDVVISSSQANIYLFKVDNRNARKKVYVQS